MAAPRNALTGLVDESGLDPLGTTASFLPRRKHQRPPARYGKRGIYVIMAPIKGLTPAGVFPQNKPFAFQCPPMDQFGEDGSHDFQDYAVIGKQTHSQEVARGLRSVQFQTLFMDDTPEWALSHDDSGIYPAQAAVKELCALRDHGKPFHLVAHQSNFQDKYEVDYAATLRSVAWYMQEPGCYYATVQFTEFTTPDIEEFLAGSKHHPHLPVSLSTASLPRDRNTLAKQAKFYYGDPSKWRVIAAQNGLTNISANTVIGKATTHRTKITVPVLKTTKTTKRGQHR